MALNLCFQIRSNSFAKRAAIAAEEQAEILKEQQKTAVGDNPMAVQSLRPILPKATTLYRTRWMPLICIGIFAIISLGLSGYVYNQNTDSQEQIDKLRGERDYAEARFDDLTAYRRDVGTRIDAIEQHQLPAMSEQIGKSLSDYRQAVLESEAAKERSDSDNAQMKAQLKDCEKGPAVSTFNCQRYVGQGWANVNSGAKAETAHRKEVEASKQFAVILNPLTAQLDSLR